MHIEFPKGPEYMPPKDPEAPKTPEDIEKERVAIEQAKKEILEQIQKSGRITEEELQDLFPDHSPNRIQKVIHALEQEGKIMRETGADGEKYIVPVGGSI